PGRIFFRGDEMNRSKANGGEINETSIVMASPNHVACELGQEIVLLQLDSGLYFSLENVGTRIWQLIQEPVSVEEVVATVNREFSGSQRAKEEIIDFLRDLNQQGLLECAPADL